jgi:hypothetical protein
LLRSRSQNVAKDALFALIVAFRQDLRVVLRFHGVFCRRRDVPDVAAKRQKIDHHVNVGLYEWHTDALKRAMERPFIVAKESTAIRQLLEEHWRLCPQRDRDLAACRTARAKLEREVRQLKARSGALKQRVKAKRSS